MKVGPDEILNFLSFTEDRKIGVSHLSSAATRCRRRANIATGRREGRRRLAEVDAGSVLVHPTKYVVQAVSFAPLARPGRSSILR